MKIIRLSEILTSSVKTVPPHTPISEVLEKMAVLRISCIVAVDDEHRPVGIFTERDAVHLLSKQHELSSIIMADVMSIQLLSSTSDMDFREAYRILQERGFRHLIVVDEQDCLLGIVTEGDFLHHLDAGDLAEFKTAEKIMSRDIVTVDVGDALVSAISLMSQHSYSCVVVMREQIPYGILTERDVVRLAPKVADVANTPVGDMVRTPLITISPCIALPDAVKLMDQHEIRHLVVTENDHLLGLLTRRDLVKTMQGSYVNFLHETIHVQRKELFKLAQQRSLFYLHEAALAEAANTILIADKDSVIQWANPAFSKLTGYSQEEAIGNKIGDLIKSGAQSNEFYEAMWKTILDGQVWHGELINKRKDGTLYHDETTITPVRIESDKITHFIAVKQNITERKRIEENLRLSASVFENSNDGILITNDSNQIIDINQAVSTITGYAREEMLGNNPRMFQSGRHEISFYQELWKSVNETGHWRGEICNRKKSGEFYIESLDISALKNTNGEIDHYVAIFNDITSEKENQKKMERMAHFDALTQLPNRTLLADRLEQGVARTDRENELLAVCFLDLDEFKPINDNYGHQIGDKLLINVATRISKILRAVDSMARIGGDEFVFLITCLKDIDELELILSRIMEAVAAPHFIDDFDLRVSASIGVTLYPFDDAEPDVLLRHADQAMYMAKRAGRNRYHIFNAEEENQSQSRLQQLEQIRQALVNKEFALYYQPKVNMRSGEVIGLEALIRWNHPAKGLVSPGEFLPLVEHSDVIIEIGDWVIHEALEQMHLWSREGLDISVSVNVAARHLQHPDFIQRLEQHITQYPKLLSGQLELEIVESAALEDIAGVSQLITSCQKIGVSFSLDDFGTGYSSLSYLKRLPINMVKIDQSFVRDLLDNTEDLAIVEGVVTLAKVFQRKVIGEGVETPEHGIMLMRLGCDLAQGYGIARPMPAARVIEWHRNFIPDPQWAFWAGVPWNYSDFPLLIAQSDHTGWVKSITRLVEGATLHLDPNEVYDHHRCRFGGWYNTHGRTRYGNLSEFGDIEPIHLQVHQVGLEIVWQMEAGNIAAAKALLPELYRLREQILELLENLQRVVTMKH